MGEVKLEGLVRDFGELRAVDHVTLHVQEGEIYGFLGPNGAGKSTVIRMLCTLLLPTAGRAEVAGFDVADQADEVRLRIGVALQDAALDPRQTGTEILRLQARLYGLSASQIDQRLAEVGRLIDIGEAIDERVSTYSGGMKRRLDLAAALVHNPEVLFLDEPTTGLDPVSRARVWEEVHRLNTELGMTIFLTTQYLEEADELANRVGIIDHGKLVAEGTPNELKRSIGSDVIVATLPAGAASGRQAVENLEGVEAVDLHGDELTLATSEGARLVSQVAVALNGAGVDVSSLTLRTPTLDDVFLEYTGARIGERDEEEEHDDGDR